jgi:hypothetical protein
MGTDTRTDETDPDASADGSDTEAYADLGATTAEAMEIAETSMDRVRDPGMVAERVGIREAATIEFEFRRNPPLRRFVSSEKQRYCNCTIVRDIVSDTLDCGVLEQIAGLDRSVCRVLFDSCGVVLGSPTSVGRRTAAEADEHERGILGSRNQCYRPVDENVGNCRAAAERFAVLNLAGNGGQRPGQLLDRIVGV